MTRAAEPVISNELQYDNYLQYGNLTILTNLLSKTDEKLYMNSKRCNHDEVTDDCLTNNCIEEDQDAHE